MCNKTVGTLDKSSLIYITIFHITSPYLFKLFGHAANSKEDPRINSDLLVPDFVPATVLAGYMYASLTPRASSGIAESPHSV